MQAAPEWQQELFRTPGGPKQQWEPEPYDETELRDKEIQDKVGADAPAADDPVWMDGAEAEVDEDGKQISPPMDAEIHGDYYVVIEDRRKWIYPRKKQPSGKEKSLGPTLTGSLRLHLMADDNKPMPFTLSRYTLKTRMKGSEPGMRKDDAERERERLGREKGTHVQSDVLWKDSRDLSPAQADRGAPNRRYTDDEIGKMLSRLWGEPEEEVHDWLWEITQDPERPTGGRGGGGKKKKLQTKEDIRAHLADVAKKLGIDWHSYEAENPVWDE